MGRTLFWCLCALRSVCLGGAPLELLHNIIPFPGNLPGFTATSGASKCVYNVTCHFPNIHQAYNSPEICTVFVVFYPLEPFRLQPWALEKDF